MFQNVPGPMSDLSWKFHENALMCFPAMLLKERQRDRQTERQTNRKTDGRTRKQTNKDENIACAVRWRSWYLIWKLYESILHMYCFSWGRWPKVNWTAAEFSGILTNLELTILVKAPEDIVTLVQKTAYMFYTKTGNPFNLGMMASHHKLYFPDILGHLSAQSNHNVPHVQSGGRQTSRCLGWVQCLTEALYMY